MPRPGNPRGKDFRTAMSDATAKLAKQALWNGHSQTRVACDFDISQGTVWRIVAGKAYAHVPWPDGRTGPLAVDRILGNSPPERRSTPVLQEVPSLAEPTSDTIETAIDQAIDNLPNDLSQEEAIRRMAEQADAALEYELEEDLTTTGPARNTVAERKPIEIDEDELIPFSDIKRLASTNPAVILAVEDKELRQVLQIVYAQIDTKVWHTAQAEKLIFSVAKTLGIRLKYKSLGLGMSHRKLGRTKGDVTPRKHNQRTT